MSLLVIMGKTCSGKDTIVNQLVNKYGYKRLVTYTTRPMRNGEKQDITYHFISEDDFKEKIDNDFFLEWRKYYTEQGIWYYGSAKEDYISNKKLITILTPEGVRTLKSKGINPTVIYLYATEKTIEKRLINRGDDEIEAKRRMEADDIDFRNAEQIADEVIFNNEGMELCKLVEEIVDKGGA